MIDHKPTNLYKFASLALSIALLITMLLLVTLMLASSLHTTYAAPPGSFTVYLPLVISSMPTAVTPTPSNTPEPTATNTPVIGFGAATGRILWNDQPLAGVTVKLCTNWSLIGGCKTQAYTAVSGDDGRYTITDIPAGEYDFATKLFGQVETGWLNINVTVVVGQTVTIPDVNVIKYDLKLISPIDHATVTTTTPTLTWEAYPGAAFYKVYVQNVVSFEKVTTCQYTIANPLAAGEYYWIIYAYNAAGTQIAKSGGYHFVVAP
jgi:hypothetical protein